MLKAEEIAQMRTDVANSLPQTATRNRPTTGKDAYGARKETSVTSTTTYPCRLRKKRSAEVFVVDQVQSVAEWEAVMPHSADVLPTDRLTIGGRVFEVVATDTGKAEATELVAHLKAVS